MSNVDSSAVLPGAPDAVPAAVDSPDFTARAMYPYLVGVYVAVNALPDAWLLVEGPDCAHMKTQFIQGNHDWLSTLTSVSGFHRIGNTALHPAHMTRSREESIRAMLARMAANEAVQGLMLTSMPMAFITGADYERLCRDVSEATGKPLIHIPGKSLSGDWMDGYGETLNSLARQLDLSGGNPDPKKVAIVGHLYDRDEEDHRANIRDLRKILVELGLDPVSIWLEGQSFSDLSAVKDAGTILSFPYGRKAARWVAKRTGARLIECDLPFGLTATERWIRQLGSEFGCEEKAEALIEREVGEIVPRLEWVVPYLFQNRNVAWIGDPHLGLGFAEIADLLGARLKAMVIPNPRSSLGRLPQAIGPDTKLLVWPHMREMSRFMTASLLDDGVSLVVANNIGMGSLPVASVEFGFPSMYTHHLFERPFLGFRGFMAFVDSMANAIRLHEVAQASMPGARPIH